MRGGAERGLRRGLGRRAGLRDHPAGRRDRHRGHHGRARARQRRPVVARRAPARPAPRAGRAARAPSGSLSLSYRELAPPPALAAHVACLWARSDAPGRVLPDGCVDVVWTGAELIVAGPATRAVRPTPPSGETKVGLRFRVGAAGGALGLPAAELLDRSPPLAQVRADGDGWAARVAEAPGAGARPSLLAEMA